MTALGPRARLKALVVDDEAPARRRLLRLLEQVPDVRIVGELGSATLALERIADAAPDVLFLDIHMPGLDGLALAAGLSAPAPAIVFVTAHSEHAVQAFDLHSVDYLLKPVRAERLEEAIRRVRCRLERSSAAVSPDGPELELPRVIAHERGATVIVDARTVTRFRAAEKYSAFLSEGRELLTEEALVTLAVRLAPFGFLRVHRAELIRLSAITAFRTEDGAHSVRLEDGQVAAVSRRSSALVRERLGV